MVEAGLIDRAKAWARGLKRDVVALWIAARDPRTPWQARLVAGLVAAYALSPIDLIPDFIPVLGYLDDLIIVPLGILLAVRLIPTDLMATFRAQASETTRPASRLAAGLFIMTWLIAAVVLGWLGWKHLCGVRVADPDAADLPHPGR